MESISGTNSLSTYLPLLFIGLVSLTLILLGTVSFTIFILRRRSEPRKEALTPQAKRPSIVKRTLSQILPSKKSTPVTQASPSPEDGPDLDSQIQTERELHAQAIQKISTLELKITSVQAKLNQIFKENQDLKTENAELATHSGNIERQLREVLKEIESLYQSHTTEEGLRQLRQQLDSIVSTEASRVDVSPAGEAPEKLLISEQEQEINRLKELVVFYQQKLGE